MKVAIMQPYFFPYVGYFQLLAQVDKFIVLDDVNFIKKGYINRNYLLFNGEKKRFTLSVKKLSQNRYINQHEYCNDFKQFFNFLKGAYSQHPYFELVQDILLSLLQFQDLNVAKVNTMAISSVKQYLDLKVKIQFASELDPKKDTLGQDRILNLCSLSNATEYWNLPGGRNLYSQEFFLKQKISLHFIKPKIFEYCQYRQFKGFVPYLSFLDMMMNLDKQKIKLHLL